MEYGLPAGKIGSPYKHQRSLGSFDWIVSDEKRSFGYLLSRLGSVCPFCKSKQYYILKRRRVRCAKCRKDYNPLHDSKFSCINLPYSKWLTLIKLFESSVSTRSASVQAKVSYQTALNAFHIVREAILEETGKSEVPRDEIESGRTNLGMKKKAIVFSILEKKKGRVTVDILRDVTTESLLASKVRKKTRGSIVYSDRWRGYDSLVFCSCKPLKAHLLKKFTGKLYIDSVQGFWDFAKEEMVKYHGVSPAKFPYYIKEMEWRYNNKDRDLVNLIVGYMLVANHR